MKKYLRNRFGIEKKIDTKEKFNFIANKDRISLVTEHVHSLSSRCADVCSEKWRVSRKNSNLNILLVLFNGNIKIMILIKIRLYVVFFFSYYICCILFQLLHWNKIFIRKLLKELSKRNSKCIFLKNGL